MNKIYKVIWNAALGTWVAVSELAKGKTKSSKIKAIVGTATIGLMVTFSSGVGAAYTAGGGTTPLFGAGSSGIAIGNGNVGSATVGANGGEAIAIGATTRANGFQSTVIGNDITGNGDQSVIIGSNYNVNITTSTGLGGVAVGSGLTTTLKSPMANGIGSVAIGSSGDGTTSSNSLNGAVATGNHALALMAGSISSATDSIAIGTNAGAISNNSIALGANADAGRSGGILDVNATAIGKDTKAYAYSIALGTGANADNAGYLRTDGGIAIGNDATVGTIQSGIAVGNSANASLNNSVALGNNSKTIAMSKAAYLTNQATSAAVGVVSVGSDTQKRRIQNLADGAEDSDAVTIAQLKDVNNRAVGNTTALGGGAAYDPATDTYIAPKYNVTTNPSAATKTGDVNTVAAALIGLDTAINQPITFAGNSGTSAQKLGSALNIKGGATAASSNANVKTVVTNDNVDIQIVDAPTFAGTVTSTGLQVNGNSTVTGTQTVTGMSNLNGGANLNNQKITGLQDGTVASGSKEAVNGGQLFTTNTNVSTAQTTANNALANAATADGKAVAAQNTANTANTTANTANTTANSALTEAQKGLNFTVNGTAPADKVGLGETVNFANGTNTTAVYDPATNTYKYNVVDAPTFAGTVTSTGLQVNGNSTVTGTQTVTGMSNLNGGANLNNQKITGLQDGTVASGSKEAVNGGQLFTTNTNVSTAQTTANNALANAATADGKAVAAQNTANTANTTANTANTTANSALTEAQKGLNFTVNGTAPADKVGLGETVNFANGTNTTAVYDPATNTYKYNVVDAPTFAGTVTSTGLQVNGNSTVTGTQTVTGMSNLNGGANLNNQKITGLQDGTVASGSKEAVNGGQLFTTNTNVSTAQTTANNALANAATADGKAVAAQNTANTANTTANSALTEAQKGLNFTVNGTAPADKVGLGETVNFANGTNTTAVYDPATNTYKYNVVDAPTFAGTVTSTGLQVNGNSTVTGTQTVTGMSNLNGGANLNNQKITGLQDGTVASGSKEAVNGGQLFTTNTNVSTAQTTANNALANAATADGKAVAAQNTANTANTTANTANTTANSALTEAQKGLNFTVNGTAPADKVGLGETVNFANGTNTTAVYDPATNTYKYNVIDAPVFAGQVKANGFDASGQTISNVASGGSTVTNAANIGDVQAAAVASKTTVVQGKNTTVTKTTDPTTGSDSYTIDADSASVTTSSGTLAVSKGTKDSNGNTAYDLDLSTATKNQIQQGVTASTDIATKGLTFNGDSGTTGIKKLGDAVAITGDTNIVTAATVDGVAVSLNRNLDLDSVTAGNTVINGAGVTTDKVTVGNVTVDSSTNKISGLEAGTAGKDAVNKDQLDSVQAGATQNTDALGNSTAANLGGGATYDSSTGALSAPSYITNDPTTGTANTASNVGDALDSLNTAVNKPLTFKDAASGSSINPLGSELAIVGDSNITTTVSQGQAAIALNKDISLDSVTAGNTVINGAGVTTDKVTVGNVTVDSSTNKISGLEAGTAGKDAVNKDQLDSVQAGATQNTDALGNSTAANLGGGATYDSSTGALSAPSYITNDPTTGTANTASNVGDALDSLNTAVNKPLTFKDAASGSSTNPLGSELAIVGDSNITTTVSQGQAAIALNKDISLDSVTAGNTVINGAGVTTDKVTVGNVTVDSSTNKISGLEAGTAGKDAVNKDQLDSVQAGATQNTDALGNSTAANLGGGATYDSSTGALSAPSYITNDPTTGTANTASNVGDALDSLNTAVNKPLTFKDAASGSSINPLGSELAIVGDSNITTTVSQGQAAIALNKDISLDSVTAGDSLLNTDGLTIVGGPSITKTGIDAAGNTISNVKDGVAGKDAVNKDQLDSVQAGATQNTDALGNSTAANLGGGATYDSSTGALSAPSYITNDPTTGAANTASNVGDALDSLNTAVNKPLTFKDAASGSSTNPLGSELAIVGDSNITTTVSQGQAAIALNKDISLDSVTAGNTVINGAGVTTDKVTVGNVTVDSSTNKISGLEAGTAGKDAVNKDQLDSVQAGATQNTDALGNSTAANLGGGATYDSSTGALSAPSYITNDPTTGTANTASNVGDALDSLNTAVNKPLTFKDAASGSSINPLGSELAIVGDSNITTTVSQGQAAIALNKDISLDSVTAGNTVINGAGVTTDKVTVGNVTVDSSTNKISGLEAGTAGKDAVNKDQLDSVQAGATQNTDALGNSTAANLGGGATYDSSTGALSAPSYITNDPTTGTANTASNVGDALDSLNTAVNKPLTFKDAASGSSINPLGSELAIVGDSNITTTVSQGQAVIALNKDISLDSVTAGNTVINGAGVTTDKVTVGNVTVDSSTNKISGLEAGTAGKDAVNKDQLDSVQAGATQNTDALGNSTAANLGGGATYDSSTGALSAPSYITNDPTTGTANTASNVGDALDSLNTAVNKPLTFKDAASGSSINPLGSELAIVGDSNITTTVSQGQAAIALNKDISLDSVTAGDSLLNTDGLTIVGGPSITKTGIDAAGNTISNVKDGVAGKDAVNKDQLDSVQAGATQNTDALGNSTAANLGGGATYDSSTGALSAPSYITNDPTTGTANTASNVGDALDSLNTAVNKPLTFKDAASGSSTNPLGSELAIVGDSNITTTVSQGQAAIALNKDISLDSVTAGNTVINGAGVTTDKVTVGNVTVDSSTNKISGLEAGTAGKDAVNKDQLDSVQAGATQNTDALGNSTAANLGGGATYDSSTGALSAPSYITNDPTTGTANTASNVGDALDSLNTAVNKPLTFKDAASGSSTNPLGSELAIVGDSNITTTVSQGQAAIALNKDISLDSVTAGDSLLNTDGLTIVGGPSITKTGIDAAGNTISNVKDGVAGKDAVNKDQLDSVQAGATQNTDALGNSTAANLGGGATYDSSTGALSAPSYITNDPTTGAANTASNVGDALDSLNTAVNKPLTFKDAASGSSTNPLGSELAIVGDSNITTTVSQGQAAIALNKDISLDSVTAGNTVINGAGVTTDKVTVGNVTVDSSTNKISGLEAGTAGKDAVNKDQLDSVQAGATQNTDALGNSTAANLGGGATYDSSTGALSAPSYITNDPTTGTANTASNVGDALDSLNTAVNKPLTFKDAASGSSINPLGSELAIVGDSNITTTVSQGQAAIALNKDISLDSVTAGNTVINGAGVTTDKVTVGNVTVDSSTNKISGLEAGTAGKDAVNKDQLDSVQAGATQNTDALGNSTAANLGGGATYDSSTGALSAPSYITNDPTTGTANTASNVGDALDSLNTAVNKPLTFKDAASGSSINPLGSELAIVGDSNITTTVSQGQAVIALNKDISLDSVTAGNTVINGAGVTTDKVTVGNVTVDSSTNKISGLEAGTAGKDAVNKDQLDSVQAGATQNTDALGNSTAANLGGGATYDSSTGALSAPSYITNDPTTGTANTASNVGDALDSLNTAVNKPLTFKDAASGSSINPLGSELAIVGDSNITTTVSQGQAAIALNKDISLDSVTAGDSLLNTDGLTIVGGPSITKTGIDAAGNTISNVKDGVAGKDAVNKDQLDSVQAGATQNTDALGNSTAANLGGGATYDSSTGALSAPSYITNDPTTGTANTASNVGDALDSLNTAVNKPLTFKDAASGSSINPLGSELAIVGDSNITTTVSQGQAVIALNKDISLDSVTAGNTVINGAGVTTDKVTVGNVTVDSSTNKISGLEAGTAGKDAVNKDQLDSVQAGATQNTDALGNSTAANLGGGATYDSSTGALSAPSYITNDPTTGTANTASNVGDALDSLNTAVNKPLTFKDAASGSSTNPLGSELAIVGDSNITTTVSQGQAAIALNKDISLDSVTAGNTVINGLE
ncbi:hypothetical protein AMD27_00165 [Acinetobacter sp. TGL-Y2]|uniref:ESPR-type extended signal peptide-containing protein n=1 Tax=Acinetobacter sp. TGL-Y2 TaxID=1407071 RepID=UPI0007A672BE|nr:ESPR-type extended signal peptide-containing protein [Acinetobacter sp. TGL-Y2]AMW77475.1 hypothetical protein AMD27_00165 [Acinetobacter sp. TGL-Y2]